MEVVLKDVLKMTRQELILQIFFKYNEQLFLLL